MATGDATPNPASGPETPAPDQAERHGDAPSTWVTTLVSWSDSPLAPMATINGRITSCAGWLLAEGLSRLAFVSALILGLGLAGWLVSWFPYWLIAWAALTDGEIISREDYNGIRLGRELWRYWLPAGVVLVLSVWTLKRILRLCEQHLSPTERREAEKRLARETAEREESGREVHTTIVNAQGSPLEDQVVGTHIAVSGARHAPRHLSLYAVGAAVATALVQAFVVDYDMYPWHPSVNGAGATILTALFFVFELAIILGGCIWVALLWVKGIRWTRYAAALRLAGADFSRDPRPATAVDEAQPSEVDPTPDSAPPLPTESDPGP